MNTSEILTILVPQSQDSQRLDKVLATLCPQFSRSRLKKLIIDGFISIDNVVIIDPAHTVGGEQEVTILVPPAKEAKPKPQDIPLDIIFEDADIIVINKPAGLVVHPAPGNYENTLVNALLAHCGSELSGIGGVIRPGIVHRLDKDTSGLLVVAKNDTAHRSLSEQLANRTMSRKYIAIVWGVLKPLEGTIEGNIGRSRSNRKKMAMMETSGKPAITYYVTKKIFAGHVGSMVECRLETGRTHQIRVHMASAGHQVIGDSLYGRKPREIKERLKAEIDSVLTTPNRHALHAYELHLVHPTTGKTVSFVSPLPEDLDALEKLLSRL